MLTEERMEELYSLLERELVPALGCTEPIAIAYAAARARALLGCTPEQITVYCSGNIIKNVKGVNVPGASGMKGIDTSAVLGAVAGDDSLRMEVLQKVTPKDVEQVKKLLDQGICKIVPLHGKANLHIIMEEQAKGHTVQVEIRDSHMNVIREEKDGEVLVLADGACMETGAEGEHQLLNSGYENLNMADIFQFAGQASLERLERVIEPQIACNLAIAEEGLKQNWGAQVGKTLFDHAENVPRRAAAYAAAASDARMGGCMLPVIINSGSGNQGITVSVPVVIYARENCIPREKLIRAVALSNLVALLQKSYIGKLSAYCGAVSAGCGSAAGIAYLCGDTLEEIENTVTNTIANVSGVVCDGAKASCAAKIATAVDAGFLGHDMAVRGIVFQSGDGLVKKDADHTIAAFGQMAREGMRATDEEILNIMISDVLDETADVRKM